VLPDLRYSAVLKDPQAMDMIVLQGVRMDHGMVAFKEEITPQDLQKIAAYVIHRANEDKKAQSAAAAKP
jgi:alcohol dehydrogenase (cytochrome c)/quinohemoprotein ethanol dehydrogenase